MELSKEMHFPCKIPARPNTEYKKTITEPFYLFTGDTSVLNRKINSLKRTQSYSAAIRHRSRNSGHELMGPIEIQWGDNNEQEPDEEDLAEAIKQVEEEDEEKWKINNTRYKWIRGFLSFSTIALFVFYGIKFLYDLGLLFVWGPVIPTILLLVMGFLDIVIIIAGVLVKRAWRNYGLNLITLMVIWSFWIHIFLAAMANQLGHFSSQLNILPFYFLLDFIYVGSNIGFLWIHNKHEKELKDQL